MTGSSQLTVSSKLGLGTRFCAIAIAARAGVDAKAMARAVGFIKERRSALSMLFSCLFATPLGTRSTGLRERMLPLLPARLRYRVLTAQPNVRLVPGGIGMFVQFVFICLPELVGHERPAPVVAAALYPLVNRKRIRSFRAFPGLSLQWITMSVVSNPVAFCPM